MADPGRWTSSATLSMSDGGRLSMTNQPRSSMALATCVRPAPDIPVMIRKSTSSVDGASATMGSGYRQQLLGPDEQEPGDAGRLLVLGSAGEEARRGHGLFHVHHQQTGRGHRVHVSRDRPVYEGNEHALVHLFQAVVLDQVRTDAPVLLGRVQHLVVDPA